jgi:hypothetical protein
MRSFEPSAFPTMVSHIRRQSRGYHLNASLDTLTSLSKKSVDEPSGMMPTIRRYRFSESRRGISFAHILQMFGGSEWNLHSPAEESKAYIDWLNSRIIHYCRTVLLQSGARQSRRTTELLLFPVNDSDDAQSHVF